MSPMLLARLRAFERGQRVCCSLETEGWLYHQGPWWYTGHGVLYAFLFLQREERGGWGWDEWDEFLADDDDLAPLTDDF